MKRRLLADRNMRVLFAGQTMNMLGNTTMLIVMAIWVKDLTGSSGAAGLIFLLLGATMFLAPVIGLLVDRFPRRLLLIVNDTLTGLVVALLLFVHDRHGVWLIYIVAGAYGLSGQVYRAARGGLLHSMVPDELLGEANGLFSSLSQSMRIIGPVAGAGVYAAWGGSVVALADIGTFAFSVASYLALRRVSDLARQGHMTGPGEDQAQGEDRRRFTAELLVGIRHLAANPVIRRMVIASTLAFAGAGMIDVAMFSLVVQGLHRPASMIGLLTSLEGVGSVPAGLVIGPMMRRAGEYAVACLGFLLCGLSMAVAATATLPGVIAGSVLIGVGLPMVLVVELTVVQRRTPAELQGRAILASDAIIDTPFTIAIAVGAGLIGTVGYRPIYIGVAAELAVVGLALLPYLKITRPGQAGASGQATAGPAVTPGGTASVTIQSQALPPA